MCKPVGGYQRDNMREHNDCKHELKYCEHCDVVYCKTCKKEWKTPVFSIPSVWIGNDTVEPLYTTTCSGNSDDSTWTVMDVCTHTN